MSRNYVLFLVAMFNLPKLFSDGTSGESAERSVEIEFSPNLKSFFCSFVVIKKNIFPPEKKVIGKTKYFRTNQIAEKFFLTFAEEKNFSSANLKKTFLVHTDSFGPGCCRLFFECFVAAECH